MHLEFSKAALKQAWSDTGLFARKYAVGIGLYTLFSTALFASLRASTTFWTHVFDAVYGRALSTVILILAAFVESLRNAPAKLRTRLSSGSVEWHLRVIPADILQKEAAALRAVVLNCINASEDEGAAARENLLRSIDHFRTITHAVSSQHASFSRRRSAQRLSNHLQRLLGRHSNQLLLARIDRFMQETRR